MREFEFREIYRQKCFICGCKNKVHTELLDHSGKFVGYALKCCACGDVHEFLLNYEENGKKGLSSLYYKKGKQTCIQPSFCPHTDCELYGKCKNFDPKNKNIHHGKQPCNEVKVEVVHTPRFL